MTGIGKPTRALGFFFALAGHSAAAAQTVSDAVVAADGSGQYRTVQEAINAAPQNTASERRWVIFIKAGTYREIVYVQREKRFVSLVGEDPATTIITYDLHANMVGVDGKAIGTFRTPTVVIDADDFTAENLTFENSAGPVGQALALRVDGDRVVFRNSRFLGWQDTIFLNRGRHYFEGSFITGHVDFIFGGATAFFERCHIHVLRNGYITAASTPAEQPYGFVISNSRITGAPGVKTYLGRPWRDYAQTTFLRTDMSDVVRAEGWHNWDKPERETTSRYSELGSKGAGAAGVRVAWSKPVGAGDAAALTAATVLRGPDGWVPERVPAHPSARKALDVPLPSAPPPAPASGLIIPLWPEGVPNAKPGAGEERVVDGRVVNVQVPTLTFYPAPAGTANGTSVIVAPGGGYQRLAIEKEGNELTRRLNALGVSAFVLKYRLVEYGHPAPLQDVLRAIRTVRARAQEFGVRPDRIGVFGSSAGGHLAATAATLYDHKDGRTGAVLDATSGRPDFVALLYPVITMQGAHVHAGSRRNLLGERPSADLVDRLSVEKQVRKDVPPVFIVHTAEDASVPVENSLMFYEALRRAGVPTEMHVYEKGAHDFGTTAGLGTTSEWPKRLEEWLRSRGFLDKPAR